MLGRAGCAAGAGAGAAGIFWPQPQPFHRPRPCGRTGAETDSEASDPNHRARADGREHPRRRARLHRRAQCGARRSSRKSWRASRSRDKSRSTPPLLRPRFRWSWIRWTTSAATRWAGDVFGQPAGIRGSRRLGIPERRERDEGAGRADSDGAELGADLLGTRERGVQTRRRCARWRSSRAIAWSGTSDGAGRRLAGQHGRRRRDRGRPLRSRARAGGRGRSLGARAAQRALASTSALARMRCAWLNARWRSPKKSGPLRQPRTWTKLTAGWTRARAERGPWLAPWEITCH